MDGIELAILGCGHMGHAIARGAIGAGVIDAGRVLAVDPSADARSRMEALGARASDSPTDVRGAAHLLLALKPQAFDAIAKSISPIDDSCGVLSVMTGWTRERIGASLRLRHGGSRVVRAMPNLAVTVGRGVTAIVSGAGGAEPFAVRLFGSVGVVVPVDESMLDAVTALSGSGPAYAFLLAESMLHAAKRLGFDDATAKRLVTGTLSGAAALLEADDRGPAELRAAVTSRGGTTEAATSVWSQRGVPEAIVDAVLAAASRAAELGRAH